jgi:hypothetical protein
MKELGFSFYDVLEHPHKYLLYYVKVKRCSTRITSHAALMI